MDKKWTSDEIDLLRRKRPTIADILEGCPFERQFSIGGALTTDLFFRSLFTAREEVEACADQLNEILHSDRRNYQVVFIHGYPGTGKSTFVHTYLHRHAGGHHVVCVDFSDASGASPDFFEVLRNQLKSLAHDESTPIQAALRVVAGHEAVYAAVLSRPLRNIKTASEANLSPDDLIDLLHECTHTDILHLFVLAHRIIGAPEHDDDDRKTIVIMDNLDNIQLSHVTHELRGQMLDFQNQASDFYSSFDVAGRDLRFTRDFRFIYCLREANYQVTRAHLLGRGAQNWRSVPFRVNLGWTGIRWRLELAEAVFDGMTSMQDQVETIKRILRSTISHVEEESTPSPPGTQAGPFDEPSAMKRVLAPIYNFDARKLAKFVHDTEESIASRDSDSKDLATSRAALESREAFGRQLLHLICESLKVDNFVKDMFRTRLLLSSGSGQSRTGSVTVANHTSGHCLLLRMVLTVVLNLSDFSRRKLQDRGGRALAMSDVIDCLLPYYSLEEIVGCIADSFLFHEKDWVSLLIISKKKIENKSDFDDEVEGALKEWSEAGIPRPTHLPPDAMKTFGEYEVELTAAGYAFLKHIMPSFELYSVIAGQPSLYQIGLTRTTLDTDQVVTDKDEQKTPSQGVSPRGSGFVFQGVIGHVQGRVKSHVGLMRNFFESMAIEPHDFKRSALAFHDTGSLAHNASAEETEERRPNLGEGVFHSLRLISACVQYLDQFRQYIFSANLGSPEVRRDANDVLLFWIDNFSQLYDDCPDPVAKEFRARHVDRIRRNRAKLERIVCPIARR